MVTVMPFGLHEAPATFQRLVDKALSGLSDSSAIYLEDIYSASWEQHHEKVLCLMSALGRPLTQLELEP